MSNLALLESPQKEQDATENQPPPQPSRKRPKVMHPTKIALNGSSPCSKCDNCGNKISFSNEDLVHLGRHRFMKHVQSCDEKCFHYTGVPNLATLYYLYIWLFPNMCYIRPHRTTSGPREDRRSRRRVLSLLEEFVLTLVRIRRGYDNECMSFLFGVSKSLVSKLFSVWVKILS